MIFDCHQSINKVLDFNEAHSNHDTQLNIAWGVDKNFMFGAAISMTSVLLHNRNLNIHFHLFTDYIDAEYQQRISMLAKQFSTRISIYLIDSEGLKILPSGNAWSHAMYFRFIAFDYLSDKIDSLLYIDADVICKGSLDELTNINLNEHVAAVIRDIDDSPARDVEKNSDYFNSGVIFCNLRQWKVDNYINSAFDILLDKNNNLSFPDQDVLNILFLNKVLFMPREYNAIYGIKQELKSKDITKYKEYISSSTILIHYIGVTKPWNSWANYPSAQYFVDAWQASPWADVPLLPARTPKQYKKKSRHERLQGKYLSSILSYIGYLKEKIKKK